MLYVFNVSSLIFLPFPAFLVVRNTPTIWTKNNRNTPLDNRAYSPITKTQSYKKLVMNCLVDIKKYSIKLSLHISRKS